jgi:hypothetical protein
LREGLQWKWLAGKPMCIFGDLPKGRNCQAPFVIAARHWNGKPDGAAAFDCVLERDVIPAAAPARPKK